MVDVISADFLVSVFSIVMIDLVLAGDNSIVIAMAVQSLPPRQRVRGIVLGALAAVLLRVLFTFAASKMLLLPLVKFVGGALILWIACKLMSGHEATRGRDAAPVSVWSAVWIILVADVTMSLDNILAVAGASHGSLALLLFGLGLSIPLVVSASTLISLLMSRYPIIMWIGAVILGKVGGEMIITDPAVVSRVLSRLGMTVLRHGVPEANHYLVWAVEAAAAALVLLVSLVLRRRSRAAGEGAPAPQSAGDTVAD